MRFNQVNNNSGDVNNNVTESHSHVHHGDVNTASAEDGNVVQSVGDKNKVAPPEPKEGFWAQAWERVKGLWKWVRGG